MSSEGFPPFLRWKPRVYCSLSPLPLPLETFRQLPVLTSHMRLMSNQTPCMEHCAPCFSIQGMGSLCDWSCSHLDIHPSTKQNLKHIWYKYSVCLWMFSTTSYNSRCLYTTFTVLSSSSFLGNSAWMSLWHCTLESAVYSCRCANKSVHRSSMAKF